MLQDLKVVIATAGRPSLLHRTLRSLFQCDKPKEYSETIVVENGPPCGAKEVLASFAYPNRPTYVHVERANKSNALNVVLESIDEDCLIVFADDDVRFDTGHLVAYSQTTKTHRDAYFGGPLGIDYENDPAPRWLRNYLPTSVRGWNPDELELKTAKCFLGCNWAIYVRDWKRAGGFNPMFGPGGTMGSTGQEGDLQQRLSRMGMNAVYVPEALVWHYVTDDRCSPRWALERGYRHARFEGYRSVDQYFAPMGIPISLFGSLTIRFLQYTWAGAYINARKRFKRQYKYHWTRGMFDGFRESHRLKTKRI